MAQAGSEGIWPTAHPPQPTPLLSWVPVSADDPEWRAVYEEIEFDCGHFGVFENAIDMVGTGAGQRGAGAAPGLAPGTGSHGEAAR